MQFPGINSLNDKTWTEQDQLKTWQQRLNFPNLIQRITEVSKRENKYVIIISSLDWRVWGRENESMVKFGAGRLQFWKNSDIVSCEFHKGSKTYTQTIIDTPQTKEEL